LLDAEPLPQADVYVFADVCGGNALEAAVDVRVTEALRSDALVLVATQRDRPQRNRLERLRDGLAGDGASRYEGEAAVLSRAADAVARGAGELLLLDVDEDDAALYARADG